PFRLEFGSVPAKTLHVRRPRRKLGRKRVWRKPPGPVRSSAPILARRRARHFRAKSAWCVSSWESRSSFHRSKSLSRLSSDVSLILRRTGSPGMNLTDEVSGGIQVYRGVLIAALFRDPLRSVRGSLARE